MRLTGGQIIANYLIEEGVRYVFGISGHGNTALLDAFVDRHGAIDLVPAIHEQGAAHMADGFYRSSGTVAAACTSIGPGATNTLTGLATAYADSIPFLLLTGAQHTYFAGRGILQEPGRGHQSVFPRMAESVVKAWWQPQAFSQFPDMLDRAFATMTEGRRGPVLLDIPQDLQADAADLTHPPRHGRRDLARPRGDAAAIEAAARLLAGARRPVILAGGGVIAAGASPELIALAERIGAPVTTTFMGKGAIGEDHDLYACPLGDLGSIPGNSLTRTADVILALGCRFGDRVSSSYRDGVTFSIPGLSKLVQVDIDGSEIGKNYPAEVGIVGDAKSVLTDLVAALDGLGVFDRSGDYYAELQDLKAKWAQHLRPQQTSAMLPMTTSRALHEIRQALARETIIVTDSSNCQNQVYNEFPVYGPGQHITAGGFSGIGFAVPAAIGAQLGAPDRQVAAILGDGSFLQTGTGLATAAMLDLPLLTIVVNNGGWEAIRSLQENLFGAERQILSGWHDANGNRYFAAVSELARSLGCHAERVEDPGDIARAIGRAQATGGPAVVEIMTAYTLPGSAQHPTGWWDITVPDYLDKARAGYEAKRGF